MGAHPRCEIDLCHVYTCYAYTQKNFVEQTASLFACFLVTSTTHVGLALKITKMDEITHKNPSLTRMLHLCRRRWSVQFAMKVLASLGLFSLLFSIWWGLSASLANPLYILLWGGICTSLVTATTLFLTWDKKTPLPLRLVGRLMIFGPWLIGQIILSNLCVAKIILSPRILINPGTLKIPITEGEDSLKFICATAITLTSGTLAASMGKREIVVHYLRKPSKNLSNDTVHKILHRASVYKANK